LRDYFLRKDAVTDKEAIKRTYKTHKNNIVLLEYRGSHKKSLFECKTCGNKWRADSWSVWKGNGCPKCKLENLSNKNRSNIEDIKKFIESKGCNLISTEYRNNRTPIKIQFECGHIVDICFNSFQRGSRCKICGMKKFINSRKYSLEKINKIMKKNNLIFIEFPQGYINRKSLIEYSCSLGHINCVAFRDFLKTKKCYTCSRIDLIDRISGVNASNWQNGLTEVRQYLLKRITKWRSNSIKQSDGKCVITGKPYDNIHHLHSFNLILKESIDELGFELKNTIGEYKMADLKRLVKTIRKNHEKYPLGVCLIREWHVKFHNIYGYGNTTVKQWYKFLNKVQDGNIVI